MITLPDAAIIRHFSLRHGLDPDLVTAQVFIESGGHPWAWNPEPHYRYLWDVSRHRPFRALTAAEVASKVPPSDFPSLRGDRDQEFWAQQSSWGLLQVMGAVAREMGFTGPFLTELCNPSVGVNFGCLYLARLLKWGKGNMVRALAAYNGGFAGNEIPPYRNEAYATKVMDALAVVKQQQSSSSSSSSSSSPNDSPSTSDRKV
jgi:hypothetical protein